MLTVIAIVIVSLFAVPMFLAVVALANAFYLRIGFVGVYILTAIMSFLFAAALIVTAHQIPSWWKLTMVWTGIIILFGFFPAGATILKIDEKVHAVKSNNLFLLTTSREATDAELKKFASKAGLKGVNLLIKWLEMYRPDMAREMLDDGLDISSGEALCKAVLKTPVREDVVKFLIENGADVNKEWKRRINRRHITGTPIFHAIDCQSEDGVKMMLKYGADVNFRNSEGKTPLKAAEGLRSILETISGGAGRDMDDIIEILLEYGAE